MRSVEIIIDGIKVSVEENGNITKNGKVYKQTADKHGYVSVCIKGHRHLVHRLVAFAYLPKFTETMQIHHKNGDKGDNRLENLECMTVQEHQKLHKQIYPATKVCIVCGKTFTPNATKRKRSVVCSNVCKIIHDKENASLRKRKIVQLSRDRQFIKKWDSARDVQNQTGFCESNINKCCNHQIKTYKGYIWEYEENFFVKNV